MVGPRSDHGIGYQLIRPRRSLRRSIEQMIHVATQGLVEAFRGSASLSAVFHSLLPMCATLKTLERIAPPIPSYAPGNKRRCSITQGNCTWMVDPCLFLGIRALSGTRYASSSPQASPVKPKVARRQRDRTRNVHRHVRVLQEQGHACTVNRTAAQTHRELEHFEELGNQERVTERLPRLHHAHHRRIHLPFDSRDRVSGGIVHFREGRREHLNGDLVLAILEDRLCGLVVLLLHEFHSYSPETRNNAAV